MCHFWAQIRFWGLEIIGFVAAMCFFTNGQIFKTAGQANFHLGLAISG
jgi:hypothetical protein